MEWNLDDSRPIWPQLKEAMMKEIVSGHFVKGGPFPTVRDLAEDAKVNRNTMQRALSELEGDGLVITNRTAGRTVTTDDELIGKVRERLAISNTESFIRQMASIGYDVKQSMEMLKKYGGE